MRYWIGRLALTGFRKGLAGSRPWLIVGITATALRVAGRLLRDTPIIATVELKRGDTVEIHAVPPPPR
jgi:hypothetical protein